VSEARADDVPFFPGEDARQRALRVAIGEARGDWMASYRRETFRACYGREPVFKATREPGEIDDFVLACKMAGPTKTLYALFAHDVRDAVEALVRSERDEASRG
jgi:hypothetical protein